MIIKEILNLTSGEHVGQVKLSIVYKILEIFCSAIPFGVTYLALNMLLGDAPWDYEYIVLLTGITVAALALQFIFGVLGSRAAFTSGYGMFCDFRIKLITHLSRLPLGFFQDKQAGALTATIAENTKMVEDIFTKLLGELIASVALPLFIGVILIYIDWRMGMVAILSAPLAFMMLKVTQKFFTQLSTEKLRSQTNASGRLLEYIDGIRVIRNFGLAGNKFTALQDSLNAQRALSIKLEVLGGMAIMLFAIVLELGFTALLVVGAYGMLGGKIAASTYIMGMVLSQKFYAPFTRAVLLLVDTKYLELAFKQIRDVLESSQLSEPESSQSPKDTAVVLENVSFQYSVTDQAPALNEVSLTLCQGETTALVGPSGAGKSTIAHLIARFHDVSEGSISIGGVDLRQMTFSELMRQVSMVLQDVYLFNDTITANIRLGAPDATNEQVEEAARKAQCHDFIMALPNGYQTQIGEGGAKLSGGQKQRLSIARALLKDSPILLLDESTASIDPENELAFRNALAEFSAEKTVLIIAHRLNTIRFADKIIVMNKGEIAQTGRHDDLLQQSGVYQELWQAAELG